MVFQLSGTRANRHPADRRANPRSGKARPPPRKGPSSRQPTGRPARASRRGNRATARARPEPGPSSPVRRSGIFVSMRNADEAPVARVAPRVIGTGQHLGAAAAPVDQARTTVSADIGESAYRAIVATDDDHAFAEIFERAPISRARRFRSRGRRPAARRAGTPASPPRRIQDRSRASRAGSCRRADQARAQPT